MGFSRDHVLTDLVRELVCAVCLDLVMPPVLVTPCHHVFCQSCLQDWVHSKAEDSVLPPMPCPSCRKPLAVSDLKDLQVANPLAWRILSQVKVKCSLRNCKWQGEYSEFQTHVTSKESHKQDDLNDLGNEHFRNGAFRDALQLYSKALQTAPDSERAKIHSNRAAVWLALGVPNEAVTDCQRALHYDASFAKARVRLATALSELGRFEEAYSCLEGHDGVDSKMEEVARIFSILESGKQALLAQTPEEHLFVVALELSNAPRVKLWHARNLIACGRVDQALRVTQDVLRHDKMNPEAMIVHSVALFLEMDAKAIPILKEAVRMDPDAAEGTVMFRSCIKPLEMLWQEGNTAHNRRDFDLAIVKLSEAVDLIDSSWFPADDPGCAAFALGLRSSRLAGEIYSVRANAYLRMRRLEESLEDAYSALDLRPDCRAAVLVRAEALTMLERHDEAVNSLEEVRNIFEHDGRVQDAHRRAIFEQRKARRPDLYKMLSPELRKVASELEIKQAYKQRCMELHPDKHPEKEEEFKNMSEAFSILCDTEKRKLWDAGYDKEGIKEQLSRRGQRDHHGWGNH
eukprot:gnl/TRDRNA2_/TRDRNA2_152022_c0_seq1.p1 gnl/TRDRNA2_/TRDRNA2_152022_c0~~gnl/TRDRNA2_/TRDRNA2_152022_c0_seq1.p1  ORF type:complete len:572 (-),score=84.72 gnl/TRDRNA2_/TRDRNA2_152022_c0_seq1:8-1723(-)